MYMTNEWSANTEMPVCPYCDAAQNRFPAELITMSVGEIECEKCSEDFDCTAVEIIKFSSKKMEEYDYDN